MPWSGGTYTRSNGAFTGATVWAQDAAATTRITSAHHDTHDQDLATGINNCLTKDGTNSATANINLNNHKLLNLTAGSAATDSARYGQTITAASLDSGTNVLTLTRADGNITVDLTAIVVGASYGNLTDKTVAETIELEWTFLGGIELGISSNLTFKGAGTQEWFWRFDYVNKVLNLTDESLDDAFSVNMPAAAAYVYGNRLWSSADFAISDFAPFDYKFPLGYLSNVSASHPADGDTLQWNASSGRWLNTPLAAVSGVVRSVSSLSSGLVISTDVSNNVSITANLASSSGPGFMSISDKNKLDALSTTFVGTFNGRSGTVTPQSGDYNVQQIGEIFCQGSTPAAAGSDNALWFDTVGSGTGTRGVYVRKSNAWVKVADNA